MIPQLQPGQGPKHINSKMVSSPFQDKFLIVLNPEPNEYPMFWIGMYIALASLLCSLAMVADVLQGLLSRKLWFPCKFFTLNAASLTLLAVASKLAVDLTTFMRGCREQLSKLTSTILISTSMANFMPSLGAMTNKELAVNALALGILVITVAVDVFIQIYNFAILHIYDENIRVAFYMLVLLLITSSTALTVPTSKEILELKYREKHRMTSNEELEKSEHLSTTARLKDHVKKYWVMAESGEPQFVMATSATCAASCVICVLNAFEFALASMNRILIGHPSSVYKRSINVIYWIQIIGMVAGTIAPVFRWLITLSLKSSKQGTGNYKNAFKIEKYWIKKLVEWKKSPVSLKIRARKCRKVVQGIKSSILNICIGVQIVIVVASKTFQLIPVFFISMVFSCFYCFNSLKEKPLSTPESANELDLSRYVLQLEGEYELPKRILKNMSEAVDKLVQTSKKRQPKNLMVLLEKCAGFKGVAEVDSEHVPRLLSGEPPKCWSLLVVTLTSIAISLPKVKTGFADQLLRSVSEGLLYVRRIEKILHNKEDLVKIEKAADVVWSRVELYHEWLGKDLHKMAVECKTPEENLQMLGDISKNVVINFKSNMNGDLHTDHLNWPDKVIAANSMYRTSQTIILKYQADQNKTCEDLFEQLSDIIADILGACLTNLPRAITTKCYCSAIEKREESVKQAARLLGETEEILKILQQHELPSLDPDQAAYLDEWVAKIKQGIARPLITLPESEITASGELHIAVE